MDYNKNMMNWYFRKYISSFVDLGYLIIAALSFVIFSSIIFAVALVETSFSNVPFPVYFHDEDTYVANIKNISLSGENVNMSIARYILSKYVASIEDFDSSVLTPYNLDNKLKFLRGVASSEVFDKFFKSIDIATGFNSPLLLYNYNNSRKAVIDSIVFEKTNFAPSYAKVNYTIHENIDKKINIIKKSVNIKFFMTIIDNNFIKSRGNFSFLITDVVEEL